MVEVANMSTFASTVDDLNLDFSDRNWEVAQQNGRRFNFEFKLHGNESESSDAESETEDCDMDDEYFFDHGLDFGLPKVKKTNGETLQNGVTELVVNDRNVNDTNSQDIDNTGSIDVITDNAKTIVDENRNEEKIISNGNVKRASINGVTLDSLTSAVEKFSLAVSSVCTFWVAFENTLANHL